jgi:triosephosphate isomerase
MKIVIGNLKMNILSQAERKKYLDWMKKEWSTKKVKNVETVICPPFVHLETFRKDLPKKISLGAQDCFSEDKGAYTGETSPLMLKDMGVEYVILGHSERRRYFAERDEEISQKVASVLKAGLSPVLCVGESRIDREEGRMMEIIEKQLIEGLILSKKTLFERLLIAYEPIWAIGTGRAATAQQANDICGGVVRAAVGEFLGEEAAATIRILYGGSANDKNIGELMAQPNIDGALIGGASLKVESYVAMVKTTSELY